MKFTPRIWILPLCLFWLSLGFLHPVDGIDDSEAVLQVTAFESDDVSLPCPATSTSPAALVKQCLWYRQDLRATRPLLEEHLVGTYRRAYPWGDRRVTYTRQTGRLRIAGVTRADDGFFTCLDDATQAWSVVHLHVLDAPHIHLLYPRSGEIVECSPRKVTCQVRHASTYNVTITWAFTRFPDRVYPSHNASTRHVTGTDSSLTTASRSHVFSRQDLGRQLACVVTTSLQDVRPVRKSARIYVYDDPYLDEESRRICGDSYMPPTTPPPTTTTVPSTTTTAQVVTTPAALQLKETPHQGQIGDPLIIGLCVMAVALCLIIALVTWKLHRHLNKDKRCSCYTGSSQNSKACHNEYQPVKPGSRQTDIASCSL